MKLKTTKCYESHRMEKTKQTFCLTQQNQGSTIFGDESEIRTWTTFPCVQETSVSVMNYCHLLSMMVRLYQICLHGNDYLHLQSLPLFFSKQFHLLLSFQQLCNINKVQGERLLYFFNSTQIKTLIYVHRDSHIHENSNDSEATLGIYDIFEQRRRRGMNYQISKVRTDDLGS